MAVSLREFLLSSFWTVSNNFLLSSKDKYFGSLLSCFGVSKWRAGFVSNSSAFSFKYAKNIRIVDAFLALVAAFERCSLAKYDKKAWISSNFTFLIVYIDKSFISIF